MTMSSMQPEYHTPADASRPMVRGLVTLSRVFFYLYIGKLFLSRRQAALRGEFDDELWVASAVQMRTLMERCGAVFHMSGLDVLSRTPGPAVFIGNHMSTLETFILPAFIAQEKRVTFIVKEGLSRQWLFGPIMRSRDPITVTRADPRQDLKSVLRDGPQKLAEGISICVFPQSTRSTEFYVDRFTSIGAKLAQRGNVPIIPVALKTDFWGNGKWIKDFGPVDPRKAVHISLGEAIPAGLHSREANRRVLEFLKPRLLEWGVPWHD